MYEIVLLAKRIKELGFDVYVPTTERYELLLYFDNDRACQVRWEDKTGKYEFYGCFLDSRRLKTWLLGEYSFNDTIGRDTLERMVNADYRRWIPNPDYLNAENFNTSGRRDSGQWKKY